MNIPLISGQLAKLHVKLETEDDFELYGGTTKAGFSITPERPEAKNEWLVTIDELEVAGKPLTRFDIYVRQISSGREWVVLSGKILVTPRSAGVDADKLAPVEYNVTIPVVENAVDLTGAAIVTGIPGPRGWSAYEIAVQNGFVGSEPEWLEYMRQQTATLAVEQVSPLMERAEAAADDAQNHADNAEAYMRTASAKAELAGGHAEAAEASKDASAAEADKAMQEKQAAGAYADAAAKSAEDAADERVKAEQARQDAQAFREGLEQAATDAAAASQMAQQKATEAAGSAAQAAADKLAAQQAKTDAQAAQVKAEQEAVKAEQNAALLGDAALKGADNAFTGNNSHSGAEVFNGAVAMNGAVDARSSAMQLPSEVLRAMSSWPALVGPLCAAPDDVGLYLGAALEEEVLVMNLPNVKNLKFTATGLMTSTVKRSGTARDGLMLNTAGCGTARVVVSIGPSIFCGNDNNNVYYDCEEMYIFITSDELGSRALPRSTMKSSSSGKRLKKLAIIAPYQETCQQDFFSACASELEDFVCIMPRITGFEQPISDGRGRMFRNLRGCRRARIYLPGLVTDLNLPSMQMDADSVVYLLDGLGDVSAAPCVATLGVGAGVAEDADVLNAVAAAAAKGWTVIFNDNSVAY